MTLPLRNPHERRPARLKRFATPAIHFLDCLAAAADAVCRDRIDLRLCFDFAPVDDALISSFKLRPTHGLAAQISYTWSRNITDATNDRDAIDVPQSRLDLH